MVCNDCGEEVVGFQEEEEEFDDTGPREVRAVQSARDNWEMLEARRESQQVEMERRKVVPQLLVYEASLYILKAMTDRLIKLNYLTSNVRRPLFQIWSHWIRRKHAGIPYPSRTSSPNRLHYLLAMVSLAASYIRSPMLPRDLCRLAATRQIPFMTALATEVPTHMTSDATVQKVLAADRIPIPRKVVLAANNLALGPYAWPALRELYRRRDSIASTTFIAPFIAKTTVGDRIMAIPESFPIGHESMTLLRLIRLLGLPDEFGARVLRWRELRELATRHAMNEALDSHSKVGQQHHLFLLGRPTEDGLMIDTINTLRICYGRRLCYGGSVLSKRDADLQSEWDMCKKMMNRWLHTGTPEDVDLDIWCTLSPQLLKSIKGKHLQRYAQLVDVMLEQKGEKGADLWGPFLQEFRNVAMEDDYFDEGNSDSGDGKTDRFLRVEQECIYDPSRCDPARTVDTDLCDDGLNDMELECGLVEQTGEANVRKFLLHSTESVRYAKRKRKREMQIHAQMMMENSGDRPPTQYNDDNVEMAQSQGRWNGNEANACAGGDVGHDETLDDERTNSARQVSAHEFNWVWEPSGIGLAWTVMMSFFEGGRINADCGVEDFVQLADFSNRLKGVVAACNRTMRVTMEYISEHELEDMTTTTN